MKKLNKLKVQKKKWILKLKLKLKKAKSVFKLKGNIYVCKGDNFR